jgi:hypothetical protein
MVHCLSTAFKSLSRNWPIDLKDRRIRRWMTPHQGTEKVIPLAYRMYILIADEKKSLSLTCAATRNRGLAKTTAAAACQMKDELGQQVASS